VLVDKLFEKEACEVAWLCVDMSTGGEGEVTAEGSFAQALLLRHYHPDSGVGLNIACTIVINIAPS